MNYVTALEARKHFGISGMTLKNWKDRGRIKVKELSERKVLYDLDSVGEYNTNLSLDEKKLKYFEKFLQLFRDFEKDLDK